MRSLRPNRFAVPTFDLNKPEDVETVSTTAESQTAATATSREQNEPRPTVIYVHGIGNKPIASALKRQWDKVLFGVDLGERSRIAYWVNRDFYPVPLPDTPLEGEFAPLAEPDTLALNQLAESTSNSGGALDDGVRAEAESLTQDALQRQRLERIALKMQAGVTGAEAQEALKSAVGITPEILPTKLLRRIVTRNITRAFLRDVYEFFYVDARRKVMENSLRERLLGKGPFVIVAHSQGSMIAYKVLSELKESVDVKLFVTIGSPLGIREVQDVFAEFEPALALQVPRCVRRWVNVADRLDPVAADYRLSNDYRPHGKVRIEDNYDIALNPDAPAHPHSATGYLKTTAVRNPVMEEVGPTFASAVTNFALARDLAESMEDHKADKRLSVLIELRQVGPSESLEAQRKQLLAVLAKFPTYDPQAMQVEDLQRYVALQLTRREIETLTQEISTLELGRIWTDAEKTALVSQSCDTIHVRPAWQAYESRGRGICWAVLDTGINNQHPHFNAGGRQTVLWQKDCTKWNPDGVPSPLPAQYNDRNGHGTHVAGIIAGLFPKEVKLFESEALQREARPISGMAPDATLVGYKVLDDAGRGRDSQIIKALQDISRINEQSDQLVIHGVNLSLGGNFDPTVYGCGHSPICRELRRLWRQGVVTCIAAGNRGMSELSARDGYITTNLDMTIGDPANLEETIAVGSVHKVNPHTYGISYFSSRGPTADGRVKPDLVAPGERILSAANHFIFDEDRQQHYVQQLYVEMSGTSMAAPHVSGLIACFLSLRREFIGYPDLVKQLLLKSCTTLDRDPYSQGRGLPSLMKMLTTA